MPSFIKNTLIVFFLIVLIQLALYLFLYQRAYRITPPGHVYTMQPVDTYYPSIIRQSKLGAWAHTYTHTTLSTPKIYTYLFYIFTGKIAAIFNIDPVVMYEVTRVAGALAVFISIYWLITLLFPLSIQIPAMIFTMVFETGPIWTNILHTSIWQWTTSYYIPPLLGRQFYLAHHLWGEALGLALICMIILEIKKPSRIVPLLIGILSVIAPLTNPTFSAILVPCVFGPWLVYAAVTKTFKRTFQPILLATAGIGCVGLFTMSQFAAGPPWNTVTLVEKSWWTTNDVLMPLLQSFSLYYPFIAALLILTPFSWKKWSPAMQKTFILAFCWSVLPIGLTFLAALPWVPFINGRIATDLSMVPIGILSTFVFYATGQIGWFRRPLKLAMTILFLLAFGASVLLSVVYFKQMIQNQDNDVYNQSYSWTLYPTIHLWNGIMALKNVPLWSHIMVNPRVTDVMVAYLPVYTYQGLTSEGLDWNERRGLSYDFYTGKMSKERVFQLFKENDISYVFDGPEEKDSTLTPTFYPDILEVMYQNPEVTIYKVRTLK